MVLLCNQLASSGAMIALLPLVGDLGDFPHPEGKTTSELNLETIEKCMQGEKILGKTETQFKRA